MLFLGGPLRAVFYLGTTQGTMRREVCYSVENVLSASNTA